MGATNSRLESLIDAWRMAGSPDQEAFPWPRSKNKWQALADDFDVKINDLPDLIDRQFLWSLNMIGAPVEKVFLAVMIWGYGDIGYGPFRVRQMFESPNFVQSLKNTRDLCEEGQPIQAYTSLKNSNIRQLGPAFGTKVLSFLHEPDRAPAILDSVVARWCNKHALKQLGGTPINAEVWSPRTYERYMSWVTDLAVRYGISASTFEQLIFEDEYAQSVMR